jgi:stage V sporulation protein G
MKSMISKVEVRPVDSEAGSKLRAFVTIELAGKIRIKNLRIIQGERGLFVSMPQMKRTKNNEASYVDLIKPINQQTRKQITEIILDEYERLIQKTAA